MAESLAIEAPDGRRLDVVVGGPEDGTALLVHGGTPSGAMLFAPHVQAGAARNLRHITYARPGYGGSERNPGRKVADCVQDAIAIADELGAERFFTIGASGGGPHALACAALLGERVLATATVGSVAPYGVAGLDWLAGMGEENLQEFAAAQAGDEQLLGFLQTAIAQSADATAPAIRSALGDLLSEVDRRALTGDFADYIAAEMSAANATGPWGWFDDDRAFLLHWGFELDAITGPATIWQGAQDRFVPPAHGEWLAGNVAGARSHLLAEHGHLSLLTDEYGRVLDDLLASATRP